MRIRAILTLIVVCATALTVQAARTGGLAARRAAARAEASGGGVLLQFGAMYGVDGPFVGEANPIRDVPGDELPWTIGRSHGHLGTDGQLVLIVRGLVFTDDEEVPPELRGTNDETEFRALVSCLTEEGDSVVTRNVISAGFPATPAGDSTIVTHLDLPNPCVAPVVLVLAGSEDKWFAVNGFESEEEEE
jgi:hypothetical protein